MFRLEISFTYNHYYQYHCHHSSASPTLIFLNLIFSLCSSVRIGSNMVDISRIRRVKRCRLMAIVIQLLCRSSATSSSRWTVTRRLNRTRRSLETWSRLSINTHTHTHTDRNENSLAQTDTRTYTHRQTHTHAHRPRRKYNLTQDRHICMHTDHRENINSHRGHPHTHAHRPQGKPHTDRHIRIGEKIIHNAR